MKSLITIALSLFAFTMIAQEENFNLVPNPSFEETGKERVKSQGEIELAEPWKSATTVPADLYMKKAKNDDFSVPENKYGKEEAKTGDNYAGVSFFGYRGRMPRSYMQTELSDTLEAGKEYCMKFHVSMSDMSKYSVNNIALYVSKGEIESKGSGNLIFVPQIRNLRNRIFDQQFLWEPICGIYKAEGGETHIAIGNFASDEETSNEKVKLSREFSGQQSNDAYYFVDDVSVISLDHIDRKDCSCDKIAGGAMEIEYKSFGTEEEKRASAKTTYILNSDGTKASETINKKEEVKSVKAEAGTEKEATVASTEVVEAKKVEVEEKVEYNVDEQVIMFTPKSFELNSTAKQDLDKLADFLKKNSKVKIEIQGHADPSETEVAFIGKRRAFEVVKYLSGKGIERGQIPYKSYETDMPIETGNAAINARVSFQLK